MSGTSVIPSADEMARMRLALHRISDTLAAVEVGRAPPGRQDHSHAEMAYRQREKRLALFGTDADLLGEPAWDIMLDLYIAYEKGSRIAVSSACVAANAPPTTALRYLFRLQERSIIRREQDPFDRRRCYVRLTEKGLRLVAACLDLERNRRSLEAEGMNPDVRP